MDSWDVEADVVVVGFGAAGACAAIEAAKAGAKVVVLDRFSGGGATALSGGVVYAGGGTAYQKIAGVNDSPQSMYDYLATEVGDAVSPETLKAYCEDSVDMISWLEEQGVPFEGSLCPFKTSYPTNDYYLYYSGSELSMADVTPPAARGHRTRGKGTSGKPFFEALAAAAQRHGVQVLIQTTAQELVADEDGRVVGVTGRTLTSRLHRLLNRWAAKPFLYAPKVGRIMHRRVERLERRHGRPIRIHARNGVVLAAGGFVNNRSMMREHAPAYRGGLPLGTPGDDGSGIMLGAAAGGATARLNKISVWRFLTPPAAMTRGVLIGKDGERVCDETRYGAAIGDAMMARHNGQAWLVVDRSIMAEARRQIRSQTLWFQRWQVHYLLLTAKKARHEIPAASHLDGQLYLIDCSVRSRIGSPAPMLTLGGLVVSEQTGQVLREDGSTIPGLYAAGRNAVGICSNSYVSGLSLADCVYSGRRAGAHAAG